MKHQLQYFIKQNDNQVEHKIRTNLIAVFDGSININIGLNWYNLPRKYASTEKC